MHLEYQCENNDCLEVFKDKPIKCTKCGCENIREVEQRRCDKCGYVLDWFEGEPWTEQHKYVYFGPDGSRCDDCVPRRPCMCNTFRSRKDGLFWAPDAILKRVSRSKWIAVDEKGKLLPCVDWC